MARVIFKYGETIQISDKRGELLDAQLASLLKKDLINIDGNGTMRDPKQIDQIVPDAIYETMWPEKSYYEIMRANVEALRKTGKYGDRSWVLRVV